MLKQFKQRIEARQPLCIRGGGSKDFYGNPPQGERLDTRGYAGIVAYEPTELFITAKCGTPLADIEATLAARGQCLACEPPRLSAATTLGGAVAAGLSGPRRASAGALRDFMLGVKILDGSARELVFGGQVMKNVAGYDVSRLIAGSLGTLGLILEATLKVLPKPAADLTLQLPMTQDDALDCLNRWGGQPLPIIASCWAADVLTLRLAGAQAAVDAAQQKVGAHATAAAGLPAPMATAATGFWDGIRDQTSPFFSATTLWRLSVPSTAPALKLPGTQQIEWGGALRWLASDAPAETIRAAAAAVGGSATLYRAPAALKTRVGAFPSLSTPLHTLHQRLKAAFDPHALFNPGRLYPDL